MADTSITVAADLSSNCIPAAHAAAWLCRSLGADAHLLFVMAPGELSAFRGRGREQATASLRDWATEQLERMADGAFSGVTTRVLVLETKEPVYKTICDYAAKNQSTLIAMGTHGRNAVEHALFGSVATSVVRHAPCDVLTVRPPGPTEPLLHVKLRNWVVARSEESGLHSILCPVDFSKGSDLATDQASELAKHFHTELHLMHSLQMPFWPMQEDASEYLRQTSDHAAESMRALETKYTALGLKVTSHMVEGTAAEQIDLLADRLETDLIVMGTHGRTGFQRLTVGSVAERVVRSSRVPVWIVRQQAG